VLPIGDWPFIHKVTDVRYHTNGCMFARLCLGPPLDRSVQIGGIWPFSLMDFAELTGMYTSRTLYDGWCMGLVPYPGGYTPAVACTGAHVGHHGRRSAWCAGVHPMYHCSTCEFGTLWVSDGRRGELFSGPTDRTQWSPILNRFRFWWLIMR